jgi:outer membrane receptor protein involved in Fe transport
VRNPYGVPGSPLSQSPPFQANLRARYEFTMADYRAFCQVGGVHQAHSYSAIGYIANYDLPAYTTYDASLGVAKDAWMVQLYGQNVIDARYVTYIGDGQFVQTNFVGRPRTMGLKYSYNF